MAKRILVADDEEDVLRVVAVRLQKAGYEVSRASNGQEALDQATSAIPDLVILDYRMPLLNGDEVCLRLKSNPRCQQVPVLFLTASAGGETPEVIRRSKADDYLVKPFDAAELLSRVKALLDRSPSHE